MAAAQLDKLWDSWTSALSGSYARSLDLLDAGKTAEAGDVYRREFVQTIKKLYSEAGKTYPLRYDAVDCWTAWTRQLYTFTRKAEDAFKKGDTDQARKLLPELRKLFQELHRQAQLEKSNDALLVFLLTLDEDNATAERLQSALQAVEKAKPSRKAKAEADAYQQAKSAWVKAVSPVLNSGALDATARDRVRAATLNFYKAYGTEFE